MWAVMHKSGTVLFTTKDKFIALNRAQYGWRVEEMTSREQFEACFENDIVGQKVTFPEFHDGEYTEGDLYDEQFYLILQAMWMAWQAASKASEQQLAAVVAENMGLKSKGREVLNEACKVYEKLNAIISSDSGDFIDGQTLHEFQLLLDVETPTIAAQLRKGVTK